MILIPKGILRSFQGDRRCVMCGEVPRTSPPVSRRVRTRPGMVPRFHADSTEPPRRVGRENRPRLGGTSRRPFTNHFPKSPRPLKRPTSNHPRLHMHRPPRNGRIVSEQPPNPISRGQGVTRHPLWVFQDPLNHFTLMNLCVEFPVYSTTRPPCPYGPVEMGTLGEMVYFVCRRSVHYVVTKEC